MLYVIYSFLKIRKLLLITCILLLSSASTFSGQPGIIALILPANLPASQPGPGPLQLMRHFLFPLQLQGPDLARRAWESLSESLTAHLAKPVPPMRAPHRLGGSQQHPSERPHMCPLCPYRATTRDSLARHIRTHTGERPFKCSYCPYRAIQKSDVDKHIRRRHKDAITSWSIAETVSLSGIALPAPGSTNTTAGNTWPHVRHTAGSTSQPYATPAKSDL